MRSCHKAVQNHVTLNISKKTSITVGALTSKQQPFWENSETVKVYSLIVSSVETYLYVHFCLLFFFFLLICLFDLTTSSDARRWKEKGQVNVLGKVVSCIIYWLSSELKLWGKFLFIFLRFFAKINTCLVWIALQVLICFPLELPTPF